MRTAAQRNRKRGNAAGPDLQVVFRFVGDAAIADQTARDIAAIVSGAPKIRLDAPKVHSAGPNTHAEDAAAAAVWRPTQTLEPISYVQAAERVVGLQWGGADEPIALLLSTGEVLNGKPGNRKRRRSKVDGMDFKPVSSPRKPMQIRVRPGHGGHNRRVDDLVDPTAELDELSKNILWRRASAGATIALVELDPNGDAVLATRISSDDRNERLIDQVRPCLALAEREEPVVRWVLLSLNMSGTRYVRADREPTMPADQEQRDDLHLIDEAIEAGWCRHVIWRDGDRIARDTLYGETALRRWQKNHVSLWLATQGRKMDYHADGLMLRAMMMVSAEERNNTTRRLQTASINKGPLRGLGWLGNTTFGFRRQARTHEFYEDEEQWPFIRRAFELAASGKYLQGGGLSVSKVTKALAAEGCDFSRDRVRVMLQNIIYSTGEFTTNVRGIPIAQKPIKLRDPVPLAQFQEVQDLLALRQGRSERTPLGEFLFNYVEAICLHCGSPEDKHGHPARIKGYIIAKTNPDSRKYRHAYWVPEKCKGGRGVFERDDLERPVVELLRHLATHPKVLAELAEVSRHDEAASSARLSEDQKADLEREITKLQNTREAINVQYAERVGKGGSYDYDEHIVAVGAFTEKIRALQERLATEEILKSQAAKDPLAQMREGNFLEILTVETPTDPKLRALRARLFQRCVSRILIDHDGDGRVHTIEVESHLIPSGAELATGNPILNATDLLDAYEARKRGAEKMLPADDHEASEIETALSERADKAVSILYSKLLTRPSNRTISRRSVGRLDSTAWSHSRFRAPGAVSGWSARVDLCAHSALIGRRSSPLSLFVERLSGSS